MRSTISRGVEILDSGGPFELLSRAKSYYLKKSRRWLRRPRMEFQKVSLKFQYGAAAPHPLKIIHVDPSEITHMLRPNFWDRRGKKYGTFVIGGNWDQESCRTEHGQGLLPFEEFSLCRSTIEHLENGVDWKDTTGYTESKVSYHSHNWYTSVEEIYNDIKKNGYKSQRELDNGYDQYFMPPEFDEIRVNISRDGEIIFDDGRHRMSALQLADVDKIPVRVFVRHKKWQNIRSEVAHAQCKDELSNRAQSLLDHPDMQDVANHL